MFAISILRHSMRITVAFYYFQNGVYSLSYLYVKVECDREKVHLLMEFMKTATCHDNDGQYATAPHFVRTNISRMCTLYSINCNNKECAFKEVD